MREAYGKVTGLRSCPALSSLSTLAIVVTAAATPVPSSPSLSSSSRSFPPSPFSSCLLPFGAFYGRNKHEVDTLKLRMHPGRFGSAETTLRGRLAFQLVPYISFYM